MKKEDLLLEQLNRIDEIHRKSGVFPHSEQEILGALAASKKIGWNEGIARCTYYLGRVREWMRKIPEAEKLTSEAKELADKNDLKSLSVDCLASQANMYLWNNKLKEAYQTALDALKTAEETGNHHAMVLSYYVLGSVSQRYAADDEALKYFQAALEGARKHGFLKLEGAIQDRLAQFFLNRHQYRHAERYARAGLYIQERLKTERNILRAKIQLASILIESGKLNEAQTLLNETIPLEPTLPLGEKAGLEICKGKLAQHERKFDMAVEYYHTAIRLLSESGRSILISNAYSILSELYIELQNTEEALRNAREALRLMKEGGDSYLETQIYKLMYEALKLSDNPGEALKYLELYHQEIAKHEGKLLESRIQFIELQAEFDMKQAEIHQERTQAEQLRIELGKRERELTTKTQYLIKQTESLAQFRDDLRAMIRRSPADDPLIREIKERLNETPESHLNWDDFDREFQSVHPSFGKKLMEKHPVLSKMENKICAMLRLGLTSVDIARLLTLSERNIENHRYRIRKKIALDTEKSLHEYLGSI